NSKVIVLSDVDKKKMNYYYGGKEKSAEEVKKGGREEIIPYTPWDIERDFNRLMDRFQRDFEDFWGESSRLGRDVTRRTRRSIAPFATMPSVDIEDQGKNYRLMVDLPGFKKEDVQVELEEDSVTINAKRSASEEEKNKNYVRHERSSQTYYRKINLPELIRSDQANAKLNNGILDISLPKKEPKETKKLTVM
ncbi:MAG TPA: Hsp20/alpha crystallin family protein, partial [Candidatus Acidoferrales bacterium]|nr:Hsp20/alpha crystallin family protein [Candidatus Acidoferrales bacterium]